ncbi:MAG: M20 family metallopeptidase [Thermofilaceae archaeon]
MLEEEKILNEVDKMEDELVKFLVNLIKIPTENPPGLNYPEIAEFIGRKMNELGYEVEYVEVPIERFPELVPFAEPKYRRINVIAREPKDRRRPVLHFNGHTDVVPAGSGWSVPPYEGLVRNEKVYGRGASDMKSGIVAMIYAVEALRRAGYRLNGSVEFSFVVDEETTGVKNAGSYYLVEKGYISKDTIDYIIITEPLNVDRVCIGHRGAIWWKLRIFGRQAHGSMPYLGVNAAYKAASLIHMIEHFLIPKLKERITKYNVVPEEAKKSSINLGVIRCGTKINTVPEECILELDRRFPPEENIDDVREEFIKILKALESIDHEFKYELQEIYYANPVIVPEDQLLVKVLEESIREVLKTTPPKVLSPGTDDQRFFVINAGINSTAVYGPGRLELAHTVDEYIDIKDLINGTKVLAIATAKLLGISY